MLLNISAIKIFITKKIFCNVLAFWFGIPLFIIICLMTTFSGIMLGKCWIILLRCYPNEYQKHCRKPYTEIAGKAMGFSMKIITSLCVLATQVGASIVFLLLSSKNIREFLQFFFNKKMDYCLVILIVVLLLLPLTMLKSPKDFW